LLDKNKVSYHQKVKKIKRNFLRRKPMMTKAEVLALKREALRIERQNYLLKKHQYLANLGGLTYKFKPNPNAKMLEKFENPHHFFILRCGVLSGMYVFGYTFYRIILEAFREPREFFIQNYAVANFIVLTLIIVLGLGLS
jgi:hypothetical protein